MAGLFIELPLDRLPVEALPGITALLQPFKKPRDLVDPGDNAAGELGKLGVDLWCRRLRDLACGLGKYTIDIEAALVDLAAEYPQRMFCR